MSLRGRSASSAEILESDAASSVEIRVHGIGDHSEWSSLGSPSIAVPGDDRDPSIALPPRATDHKLRLVSWNRTSRHGTGWLWYLALPFTMANAASEMRSATENNLIGAARRTTVWIGAIALTFLATVWLIALGETIIRRLSFLSQPIVGQAVAVVAASILLVVVFYRSTRPFTSLQPRIVFFHTVTILVTAGAAVVLRPAHVKVEIDKSWQRLFTTRGPGDVGAMDASTPAKPYKGPWVNYLDPVMVGSLGALTLVALASSILVLIALIANLPKLPYGRAEHGASPSAPTGSVIALASALLLFLSVASALRLALENILGYVDKHFLHERSSGSFNARGVLPYQYTQSSSYDDWIIDLFPLLGAVTFVILLSAVLLMASRRGAPAARREARENASGRARVRAVWIHAVVTDLGPTLLPAVALTILDE